jgi:hypothetical protein
MKYFLFILQLGFLSSLALAEEGGASGLRSVDFRVQLNQGTLNFTSISGQARVFEGVGSELASHIYLIESTRFRTSLFISSRIMSYTGKSLRQGEVDDLQTFSVAPGLELSYGIFYVQAAYQSMNVNNYWISSTSIGKRYDISGMSTAAGINYKMGHLGIGLGATTMTIPVDGEKLGIATSSSYQEVSYSFNLTYYIGTPLNRFFPGLFRSQ